MRSLIVNTSDVTGGAARAAYRLHQGLQTIGESAQMLVALKQSDGQAVLGGNASSGVAQATAGARLTLERLPLKLYKKREGTTFSSQWLPETLAGKIGQIAPDVVNLHWINAGFMRIETLAKLGKPIVWTLHDMWAFTGGCHYSQQCDRYMDRCGSCPQLGSDRAQDLSRWVWQRKAKAFSQLNLTVVTPSRWLADCARKSSLLAGVRVECIPNGIDTRRYKPIDKNIARAALNLPLDKSLILFGSLKATSDKRKGFHLLQSALQSLSRSGLNESVELVIFGDSRPERPPEFGFNTHYLGSFGDDLSLSLVYSAADVFVLPSVQENLANTILEALACGVPCLAFKIGGMPDMIEHQQNGYLAAPFDVEDLAQGIARTLEHVSSSDVLSQQAIASVAHKFTLEKQAQTYASLFREVCA